MSRRDSRDTRIGYYFLYAFVSLIAIDCVFLVWHMVLLGISWHKQNIEDILSLILSATHFITNTIAVADLLMHLLHFVNFTECEFEPAKSTNAFLFSLVGCYVDFVAALYDLASMGSHRVMFTALFFGMVAQSAACSIVSITCFFWGSKVDATVCEGHPVAMEGTGNEGVLNNRWKSKLRLVSTKNVTF